MTAVTLSGSETELEEALHKLINETLGERMEGDLYVIWVQGSPSPQRAERTVATVRMRDMWGRGGIVPR